MRDKFITIFNVFSCIAFIVLIIWLLTFDARYVKANPITPAWINEIMMPFAQEVEQPSPQQKIKTWRMPADLHQGLIKMVDDFNKEYNAKIEIYKQVLRSSSDEFADMPEDAVFDLQSGVFLSQNDYKMLQERAKKLQEQVIKEKASGEMKKEAENEVKK